jgi:feruloyl esterase
MLSALERWVEQGHPPERVTASLLSEGKTIGTRPLCPYPQIAQYTGKGSSDDAASFVCRAPQ